jgi:hypothetical protein
MDADQKKGSKDWVFCGLSWILDGLDGASDDFSASCRLFRGLVGSLLPGFLFRS